MPTRIYPDVESAFARRCSGLPLCVSAERLRGCRTMQEALSHRQPIDTRKRGSEVGLHKMRIVDSGTVRNDRDVIGLGHGVFAVYRRGGTDALLTNYPLPDSTTSIASQSPENSQ